MGVFHLYGFGMVLGHNSPCTCGVHQKYHVGNVVPVIVKCVKKYVHILYIVWLIIVVSCDSVNLVFTHK